MGFFDFLFGKKRNLPANHEPPNFKMLIHKTHFSKRDITNLHERFLALCNYNTGLIEKIAFVQQPELALNPIIDLAYDMECLNYMKLRLATKKEKDDQRQLELEELAMMTSENISQSEQDKNNHKQREQKRRHRRKKKNNRGGDDHSDMHSHGGSLESLDGLESLGESVDSLDMVPHDSQGDVSVVQASQHSSGVNNDSNVEGDDADGRGDNLSARISAKNTKNSRRRGNSTEEEGEAHANHNNMQQSHPVDLSSKQSKSATETTTAAVTTNKVIEGDGKIKQVEEHTHDESDAPMTSSFFRAQHRLKQLEEEKRLAEILPPGLDFNRFVIMLSEFSPKATSSAKTSYFFKIMAVNGTGCVGKVEYLSYLKRVTFGLVPPYLYDEFIDVMWDTVCAKLLDGEREITRKMFARFVSTIDVNLFMTIPF